MNAFRENIARAKEKGWHEGARRMEMERRMASALVIACLGRGYFIWVHNGEDWAIKRSKSYRAIMDALWQCDEETIRISKCNGLNDKGWFFLVYGNDGYDLIADYSDNAVCNEIWENVLQPLSDRLCMA